MSDTKSELLTFELITKCMNQAALEFEIIDTADPRQSAIIEELTQLDTTQASDDVRRLAGSGSNKCTSLRAK